MSKKLSRDHIFEILDMIEKECNEERISTGENAYGLPETLAWRHEFTDAVLRHLRDVRDVDVERIVRPLTDDEWNSNVHGGTNRVNVLNSDLAFCLETNVGAVVEITSAPFEVEGVEFVFVRDGGDRALATRTMLGIEL